MMNLARRLLGRLGARPLAARWQTYLSGPQSAVALGQLESPEKGLKMATAEGQPSLREALAEIRALRSELLASHAVTRLLAADILFSQQTRDHRHVVQATTHAYSQNYEDAIIAEIYSRIGEQSRVFVEIGIETGVECNTRALLERGWTGVWIDANPAAIEVAKSNMAPFLKMGTLKIIEAMVARDNVQEILSSQAIRQLISSPSMSITILLTFGERLAPQRGFPASNTTQPSPLTSSGKYLMTLIRCGMAQAAMGRV